MESIPLLTLNSKRYSTLGLEILPQDKNTKFICFGGDGGTYDIGLQSLSGAMVKI